MFPATPNPPLTRNAPLVVLVALLVLLIVTIAFELNPIVLPLSALNVSSAMLPTFVMLLSLKLVAPKLALPVALILLLPMSILPNPWPILPAVNCPVPVMSNWCCYSII